MKMKKMLKCLILLIVVLGVSGMAFGADPNWIGLDITDSTDWHAAANWNTGTVPDDSNDVYLGKETAEAEFATTVVNIDAADAYSLSLSIACNASVGIGHFLNFS